MRRFFLILLGLVCGWGSIPGPSVAGSIRTVALSDALTASLHHNPWLAAAALDTSANRSRVRESRAALYPELVASLGYTRHEEPNIIVPIHEAGVFPPLDDDIYEGRLDLLFPLFDGGRRRARLQAAEAGLEVATAHHDAVRIETIATVSQLFVEARRVDDRVTLVTARLAGLRERRREIEELLRAGRVSEGDRELVEAALAQVWADSVATVSRRHEIALQLGMWMGSNGPVRPSNDAAVAPLSDLAPVSPVPASESPSTREAAARVHRAEAEQDAARGSYWPEITAFAAVQSRAGDELDFTDEWAAGLAIRLPIFTGGKRRAGRQVAAANRRIAGQQHAAALLERRAGVHLALSRWETVRSRHESLLIAVGAKQRAVEAQQVLYAAGRLTLAELLTQENELLALRLEAADLVHVARSAILDHEVAAGSLTVDRAQIILGEES